MSTSLLEPSGRRYLIWILATFASIQPFFHALQAVLDHERDHFLVWTGAYLAIVLAAIIVERATARHDDVAKT